MKIYSPITNIEIINLELANYFYEQGNFNIFNKNDKFYNDICLSANVDGNDIILDDRLVDIYPHEAQICPNDCECLGINFTTSTFICNCDIKLKKNDEDKSEYQYELMNIDSIVSYFKDFNNLIEFFTDMINYKIVKCYELLYDLKNYKNNIGFYIAATAFITSMFLLICFTLVGFKSIRAFFYNNLKNLFIEKRKKRLQYNNDNKISKNENKNKINILKYKKSIKKEKTYSQKTNIFNLDNIDNAHSNKQLNDKNKIYYEGSSYKSIKVFSKTIDKGEKIYNENKIKENDDNNSNINKMSNKEMNELSYFEAKKKDKRDFCIVLFSILFNKIDLVQNIFNSEEYSSRLISFNIYLVSSYIDLLMNCILFNDYALSQKYHCNGKLEFITSFIISSLSNILSFIILYCIKYLTSFPAFIEAIINEIHNIDDYLHIIAKFFKILKSKIFLLFIVETILGLFVVFYISIFSAIYSNSINSFLLNYLYSQLKSLLYSFFLSIIIAFLRRISLLCHYKRLYIISFYFNENF
jgi:hypothetical protein